MSSAENLDDAVVDETTLLQQRCIKHIIFSGLLSLIMLLALIGLITFLVFTSNSINQQKDSSPLNVIDELATTIEQNINTIKEQHQDNKDFLKIYQVLPLIERYPDFYQAVVNSEKHQGNYISDYQSLMYDLASRVRGSGEWHSFFTKQLDYYQQRCQNRNRYLSDLKPIASPQDTL
jgi:hypothetical protein